MFDRIEASYARIRQFTADASHELRTPVALIQANGECVLMEPRDEARMVRGIAEMLKETAYMTQLINDLLILARSDQAAPSSTTEIIELEDAIAEVMPRFHAVVNAKHIQLVCHRSHHVVAVRGDRFELQRLAMILIENAVRYTPADGAVTVTFWSNQVSCGFAVKDSGVGIAPEDCKHIFQRFYRVDSVRTPGDGGTGLGLAIANGLVTGHGGTIEVQSELGKGSCFTVHLPRAEFLHASSVFAAVNPPPFSNASH
jgi:signal transduction histidine kinase